LQIHLIFRRRFSEIKLKIHKYKEGNNFKTSKYMSNNWQVIDMTRNPVTNTTGNWQPNNHTLIKCLCLSSQDLLEKTLKFIAKCMYTQRSTRNTLLFVNKLKQGKSPLK
jgi:hypothetical protein